MRPRHVLFIVAIAAAGYGAFLIHRHDPASVRFFPPCFWKFATGWDCPGCGTTRAVHRLLHGELAEAVRLNPLSIVGLPFGLICWAALHFGGRNDSVRESSRSSRAVAWLAVAVVVAFGIWRNTPSYPFGERHGSTSPPPITDSQRRG